MKKANVVQVRDLGPLTPIDAATGETELRVNRMTELLRRYPQIGEAEKAELLLFLRKGAPHEVGRVGRREGVAPRLARFRRDHPTHFRLNPAQLAGLLVLVILPLMAFAWICFG